MYAGIYICWHVLHSLHTNEWSKRKTLKPQIFSLPVKIFTFAFLCHPPTPLWSTNNVTTSMLGTLGFRVVVAKDAKESVEC